MSGDNDSANPARQKFKAALIPVLALILAALLFRPDGEGDPPAPEAALAAPQQGKPVAPRDAPGDARLAVRWPEVDLARAAALSPFDPLEAAESNSPSAAATESADAEEAPSEAATEAREGPLPKVEAIYGAPGRRVAVVEGRIVQVGDALAHGRVVAITATELILDPAPLPSAATH